MKDLIEKEPCEPNDGHCDVMPCQECYRNQAIDLCTKECEKLVSNLEKELEDVCIEKQEQERKFRKAIKKLTDKLHEWQHQMAYQAYFLRLSIHPNYSIYLYTSFTKEDIATPKGVYDFIQKNFMDTLAEKDMEIEKLKRRYKK